MKPIGVYALAIENNHVTYTSTLLDQALDNYYPDGKKGPKEWYGSYLGSVPLNYALRKSMNAPPVRLLKEKVGVENSYNFLKNKLHLTYLTEGDKNLSSLALGGTNYGITVTQSAAAFAIFGNQGVYYEPTTYYKIENTKGDTIISYENKKEQVISPATATIMNHLLQEVVYQSEGTGRTISGFNYKMKAYAKTGTSSDKKDSWLVAGTPYYVGSVWYGYDSNLEIQNSNNAKQIWRDIMKEIHNSLPKKEFVDSKDVYKKGSAYYKNGTKPGTIVSIPSSSSSEASSSQQQTPSTPATSTPATSTPAPSTPSTSTPDTSTPTPSTPSGGSSSTSSGSTTETKPGTDSTE